ncbi:MAG: hypothetical protein HYT73_04700 [Candidatus Aenigmarchaeota archaeon]|nr:hypothetical protein [Candidatus Aenigmarchaeota archaeon]
MPPTKYKTEDEWRNHGIEKGYDNLSPSEVKRIDQGWYERGRLKGWRDDFDFKRKRRIGLYNTEKDWRRGGIEHGYDKMSSNEVQRTDASWYSKGSKKRWLVNFEFQKSITRRNLYTRKNLYDTEDDWRSRGIEMGYDRLNPTEVMTIDKYWYHKGRRKKWIRRFDFKRKVVNTPDESRLAAVAAYLFTDKSSAEVAEKYGIHQLTILRWSRNDEILSEISRRKRIDVEETRRIRNDKVKRNNTKYRFNPQTRIDAVTKYLFSDKSTIEIAEMYGITRTSIRMWYNDDKILSEIARRSGKTKEELERMYDVKTGRINPLEDSPKLEAIRGMPLTSAELIAILSATDEMRRYSPEDAERMLARVPKLNVGPLSLQEDSVGSYDAVSLVRNVVRTAPEVVRSDDVSRLLVRKLGEYYERKYPESKHDPDAEEMVIERIREDLERILKEVDRNGKA